MQSAKTNTQNKIKGSSKLFAVAAGMAVITAVMTAIGGTYGGVLGAFITGTAFATGLVMRTAEKRREAEEALR